MNTHLLMITFRVWFIEIAVSGVNYFLLMNRVYAPRLGELRAHRIGMTTRIVYIFPFAYFLVRFARIDSADQYLLAGTYWLLMVLAFEWIGSFIIRRPVHELLEGWHIEQGYMWPYVLLAYLFSPLIVGLLLPAPARSGRAVVQVTDLASVHHPHAARCAPTARSLIAASGAGAGPGGGPSAIERIAAREPGLR